MSNLSQRPALAALSESHELGESIAREAGVDLLPIEERPFESGEFKLRPLETVRGRTLFVVQTLAGTLDAPVPQRLLRLLFLLQGLRDAGAEARVAVLPYFAFARKDRRTQARDPVTSRYVAELLEAASATHVIGLDVHNPASFDNAFRIPTIHLTALPMLADHFARLALSVPDLAVVSPDVGGIKRAQLFRELLSQRLGREIELAFIEKRRARGIVTSGRLTGDVAGKVAIVFDDLCATGGTLIRAADVCLHAGAEAVQAAVTHAPLASGIDALMDAPEIAGVTITDSTGTACVPVRSEKRVTLPVAPLFGEVLRRMIAGQAVAPLLTQWPVSPQE